jgi:hypothetical protein
VSKAFVDTTVLANVLLKRGAAQQECIAALQRFQSTESPTYALKELKAGALFGWIWLHNKCVAYESYSKVAAALSGMAHSRRRNLPLTAIEAWEETVRNQNATLGSLAEKYGPNASEDRVKSDRLRLGLRKRITTAWRDRKTIVRIVHPLPCYEDAELTIKRSGLIDPWPTKCDPTPNCHLARLMADEPETISRLYKAVKKGSSKPENNRRLKALRHILRTPKRPISDDMCRALGDAVFAFLAPPDSVVLTTNIDDHTQLAEALGKSAETP